MATKRTKRELMAPQRQGKGASRASKDTVLTLKITGPGIRKGRISVPDLIKICQDTQSAVNKQAEALAGRKTLHPGPVSGLIKRECTLELIGIRDGSTELDFGLAKPQMLLPDAKNFGSEVVHELAETIKSLGNGNKKSDLDPGVLQSIYGLGGITEAGSISTLKWSTPNASKEVTASVNKKVRERAAVQLSRPTFKFTQVDGVLDMADFSRRDRKCRIDPAIGAPVVCTFGPEHENEVHALIRQPVRVSGTARIQPGTDRIDSLEIVKIEALPSLHLGEGNFMLSPSLEHLAVSQGVTPLKDVRCLGGMLGDDEVEEFISAIYESRERH
jgi:hypothetical protein